MNYATRIRNLRIDHDKSQQQIANILHTTKGQIGRYERGESSIPLRQLFTICQYYHVSADYILGLPEDLPYGLSKTK